MKYQDDDREDVEEGEEEGMAMLLKVSVKLSQVDDGDVCVEFRKVNGSLWHFKQHFESFRAKLEET